MPTVLVAEDDPDIRSLVVFRFTQAGFSTLSFGDGEKALAAAKAHLPDVVVLDLAMPGKSGIEICSELRADPRTERLAILLLAGSAADGDVLRGLAAGADDYLLSPVNPRDLVERVAAMCDRVSA